MKKLLLKKMIENLVDVTCCLIGNDNPTPSLIQESVFSSGFFSYEDKYLKGGGAQTGNATQSIIIPARLDKKITKEIQDAAKKAYKVIGCSGIARVDFLYDKKQRNGMRMKLILCLELYIIIFGKKQELNLKIC